MNQNKKDNLSQLLIFTLSLLGVFLTLYLHFEQANNFEQGCSEGFDCKGVIDSFKILGLSNIYWGLIYYISILLFGVIPLISNLTINQTIIKLRNYSIVFGSIYSLFLIFYQYFKLEAFCSLCLVSSLICFAQSFVGKRNLLYGNLISVVKITYQKDAAINLEILEELKTLSRQRWEGGYNALPPRKLFHHVYKLWLTAVDLQFQESQ